MNRKKGAARAIVPRSVLMYAGLGVGAGVIPVCVAYSSTGCGPSIGILPPMFDMDATSQMDAPSVGIEPAMAIDASDAQPVSDAQAMDAPTVGIDPALLDAEADGGASDASSVSDAGEASTVDP